VADAIRSSLRRPGDFPARLVAAEFAIVLPRTDESGALCVAERIRSAIHALDLPHAGSPSGRVGVAIGVSSAHPSPRSTWEELDLVAAARRALIGARSAVGHDHILSRSLDPVSIARRRTAHARQHARVAVRMPALVWAERRALSIPARGQISVLGPGGARLDVGEPYAVGAVLSLSFALAPSHGITCRAVIRDRPAPRGVGVEFLDLHPDTRQQLSSYIASQLPDDARH
jgi:GGDEF domain-containing protein